MIPPSGARGEYRWCYCITSILKFVCAIIHVSKTRKCLLTAHFPQTRERIAAIGVAVKKGMDLSGSWKPCQFVCLLVACDYI